MSHAKHLGYVSIALPAPTFEIGVFHRILPGTGTLSFDDFCTLAAKFMTEEEEDSEAIKTELREAFRLYDKEGSVHAARRPKTQSY